MHDVAAMNNDKVIEILNDLIQLDYGASKTYEQALEHVDEEDDEVRMDLHMFMQDHVRHIEDLSDVIEELGGEAQEPGRDVKGVLLEGMTKLRSVTGTKGALKAMRMNEKLTNKSYDDVAEKDLPTSAQEVVMANRDDERRHLAAIEAHIDRLRGSDDDIEIPELDQPGAHA